MPGKNPYWGTLHPLLGLDSKQLRAAQGSLKMSKPWQPDGLSLAHSTKFPLTSRYSPSIQAQFCGSGTGEWHLGELVWGLPWVFFHLSWWPKSSGIQCSYRSGSEGTKKENMSSRHQLDTELVLSHGDLQLRFHPNAPSNRAGVRKVKGDPQEVLLRDQDTASWRPHQEPHLWYMKCHITIFLLFSFLSFGVTSVEPQGYS